MANYRIARCPFPVSKITEIHDVYTSSKGQPGGCAIRYRMPKQMVSMVNEKVSDDDGSGTYGMGLGDSKEMTFLLQPRQFIGLMNAKSKGKSYPLVLSAKQLKSMEGQGIFGSLFKAGKSVAKSVAKTALKEAGKEAARELTKKALGGAAEESECDEDCDLCDKCNGSGLLAKQTLSPYPLRRSPKSKNLESPRISM